MSNTLRFQPGAASFGGISALVLILLLVLVTMGCWHIVPPGHRGVSVTLGTVDPQMRPSGITFKKPLVEDIIDVPIQQITVTGQTDTFSSDLQTVNFSYSVLYRIPEDNVVTLYRDYRGDPYTQLVDPRLQDILKQVTALYRAEDLVKNRETIKVTTLERLRAALAGLIEVVDVPITNIDLTEELEKAIELKQVTEQQALAKEYELQKAKKEAEITLVNAKAEAEAVQIKGKALADSPRVVELEIAKKWDGKAPQTVVVGEGGANVLLPLR
jgi:prohibitin 2